MHSPARSIAAAYITYATFAVVTWKMSTFEIYRPWALDAAPAYALAGMILVPALFFPKRDNIVRVALIASVTVAIFGSVAVPLAALIRSGTAMPEVAVIQNGGELFIERGTPFLAPHELTGEIYEYNPYLPGMAWLGVVATLLGIDLRIIFVVAFVVCVAASIWLIYRRSTKRPTLFSTAAAIGLLLLSPFIAMPLVAGGDDLPVFGLMCLGLALTRSSSLRGLLGSGAAIGTACALKAIAVPALPIAIALVYKLRGTRAALRHLATSIGVFALIVAPPFLRSPEALIENTIKFPLGLAQIATTASDPLPGHLIAAHLPGGKLIALSLLLIAGVLVAASLWRYPVNDLRGAAIRLATGMALAFALAPAVRWGYFMYPLGLLVAVGLAKAHSSIGSLQTNGTG